MSEPALVSARREGPVAYLTLDRPGHGNAFTHAMMCQLASALEAAGPAGILVLAANGADFSVGRDQSERPPGVTLAESLTLITRVNGLLAGFGGISVAAVRGRALGFGSGLAIHCDITVASSTAVFGFDEIAHGFPPLIVETYLGSYLPRKAALELVLTGRRVTAAEALALGMVSRVVPDGELAAATAAVTGGLAAADARALRRAKSFFAEIGEVAAADRAAHGVRELAAWRGQRA